MSEKKITLKSCDGLCFFISAGAALESNMIKHLIDDNFEDFVIPLPIVTSKILQKVIEYCEEHAKVKKETDELKAWDAEFIRVDLDMLYGLLTAANYLHIPSLLDLSCKRVAEMIKETSPEYIRQLFGIENDFSPEEEEELRRKTMWAFQDSILYDSTFLD